MIPTITQQVEVSQLVCVSCGAETNASCNCGKPYVPKIVRAIEAVKTNPEKSNRAIAQEIGVSYDTVNKARKQLTDHLSVETGPRLGLDGKTRQVPAKDKIVEIRPPNSILESLLPGTPLENPRGKFYREITKLRGYLERVEKEGDSKYMIVEEEKAVIAEAIMHLIEKLRSAKDRIDPTKSHIMEVKS